MTKEEIGAIIKKYRTSAGLTQSFVAEQLNRPQQTIANWEVGRSQPDANTLFLLFHVLGVSIDEAFGIKAKKENAPLYSSEALKLAGDYDSHMDDRGRETVRAVADFEIARKKTQEQRQQMEAGEMIDLEKVIRFSVPGYSMPLSAGTGQEAGQEYPENYKLIKEPPRGTSFIARVSGVSMEPTYHNGELVFVHSTEEIPVGRIGAFFMDGQQWIKELGDGELISHNPEYDPIPMREDIRCQGLVLGVCDESYFE